MNDDDEAFEPLSPEEEEAVHALLASLPTERMPVEVLARIEAALAAQPPIAAPGAADVVPLDEARAQRRPSRSPVVLTVAASVVGVLAAVAVGIAVVDRGSSSPSGGADTAAAEGATVAASSSTGRATAPLAATPEQPGAPRLTRTGRSYDAANLALLTRGLLTGTGSPVSTPGAASLAAQGSATSAAASARAVPPSSTPTSSTMSLGSAEATATTPTRLAACVRELTSGDGRTPIAVDVARWGTQPVLVVVLPSTSDASSVAVYVVRPTCGAVSDSSDVVEFATVSR
ncbi:MAG TPA: hypothetical protein VMI11_10065 [Actinomycetes bacterium]|nr:hypothetical protein [Actinomycetes bacterium]